MNRILQIPNAFSIGSDFAGSITDTGFGITRGFDEFGHLEDFTSKALTKQIEVAPISRGGVHLYRTLFVGAELDIKWAKVFSALQYFWHALQSNYFDLHQFSAFDVAGSVLNRDGTVDEFVWSGVEFDMNDFGDFMSNKQVNNSLKAKCQRFEMVSPNAPALGASPLSFQ